MYRGCVDFAHLYTMHKPALLCHLRQGRARCVARVLGATDRTIGVICVQRIVFHGFHAANRYPRHVRRICFKGPESQLLARPFRRGRMVQRSARADARTLLADDERSTAA